MQTAEEKKAVIKKWKLAHKEELKVKARQYYLKNGEEMRRKNKEYRTENKEVVKERNKRWYKENPDKVRDTYYQRRYGISLADYDNLLEKQGGVCAICGTTHKQIGNSKHFHVDHNHTTNEVRGLLCHNCNLGIGNFKDSIKILEGAISYLKEVR